MIEFLYGLLLGVIFANFCVWRMRRIMGRTIDSLADEAQWWMDRAFAALALAHEATKLVDDANTLSEFERTANEIASLPEVEK